MPYDHNFSYYYIVQHIKLKLPSCISSKYLSELITVSLRFGVYDLDFPRKCLFATPIYMEKHMEYYMKNNILMVLRKCQNMYTWDHVIKTKTKLAKPKLRLLSYPTNLLKFHTRTSKMCFCNPMPWRKIGVYIKQIFIHSPTLLNRFSWNLIGLFNT